MTSADIVLDDSSPGRGKPAKPPVHAQKRKRLLVAAGILAAVAFFSIGSIFAYHLLGGGSVTIRGSMTVQMVDIAGDGTNTGNMCADGSSNGYGDLAPGTQVVITDDKGATLGIGQLGFGHRGTTFLEQSCKYNFEVANIDANKPFYGIHIGNQSRGISPVLQSANSAPDLTYYRGVDKSTLPKPS